jgi:hypothetical protein
MIQLSTTIIFLLFWTLGYSQQYNKDFDFMWLKPQRPNIKTLKKTENDKLLLLQEFDRNGNCYFIKNDSLNGDVTAIWGIEYDEKGREAKTIFAHSNVGFYIYETVYSENIIKQYTYTVDTVDIIENIDNDSAVEVSNFQYNPYNFVKRINSKPELENLQNIIDVYKQKRYLEKITILNAQGKPANEFYLDHMGDTTSYSTFIYKDKATIDEFRYKKNRMTDDYNEYLYFDNNKNLIKSFRIFYSENNRADTSDFKINTYNFTNKIVSTTTIEHGKIFSTITYEYDKDRLVLEKYTDRPNETRNFSYKYNEKGELIEEKIFDKLKAKTILINKYKTTYEYWQKNYR